MALTVLAACFRAKKKRIIAREALGPAGSIKDPKALPPDQA